MKLFQNTYKTLPATFYQEQLPTPVSQPNLILYNKKLAQKLGIPKELEDAQILSGNKIVKGSTPIAQAYAGHQFGHFTMLGDGRAILLGEFETEQGTLVDLQLKGPGRTPYSRGGDGRAALGPMLREYIISEAMHGLGIPTTRSLAVVETGDPVYREIQLEGAILTRVADSHIRVGTFQYASRFASVDELKKLADYTIDRHYPELAEADQPYLELLGKVMEKQIDLVTKWQMVGFIHGVMNTDNMTISGQTIDYGPCAFMNVYDPDTVFSSIDHQGRYAYGNQGPIAGWNLARLAEALIPLLHEDEQKGLELAQEQLYRFPKLYEETWLAGMKKKLGLLGEQEGDEALVNELLSVMKDQKLDFTNTFRALTLGQEDDLLVYPMFSSWYQKWKKRVDDQPADVKEQSKQVMKQHNPHVIPRNHLVEETIEEAVEHGDYGKVEKLIEIMQTPYEWKSCEIYYTNVPGEVDKGYQTFCGT
ncbi:protein adenylyltransferase SelO [Mangrovibacillus cuniculi]|uniref:Protein nucleotidyltransferase YdiU n=1 Tax=Mangrovibacillus cuniculi TaxID=2593652 RepID=A0A7S8C954_9BACI|nr:YdiU family protein [Mangrovibacillus cuniculi]QPC45642.1 YdiU family protein [Mangrovibacillus cuniculi]